MKSFTIFYNTENPLYLKIENHEEFINWLNDQSSNPIYTYNSSNKNYYIIKNKINYIIES